MEIEFWRSISKFAPALLICAALGFCIMFFNLVNSIVSFLLYAVIYVICFSLAMWFLGMNEYEKQLFIAPLHRILGIKLKNINKND